MIDVKEYLEQYGKNKRLLYSHFDELNRMKESDLSEGFQEYLNQIYDDIADCLDKMKNIHSLIYESIPLLEGEALLVVDARYIKEMPWKTISQTYGIDMRTATRREQKGLMYIEKHLNEG